MSRIVYDPCLSAPDVDGERRLETVAIGDVTIVPARTPDNGESRTIYADTPLEVDDDHTTSYTIPDGKVFFLREVTVGTESHPSEKSLRVDVVYYDGSAEHLVHRVYSSGQTVTIPCEASTARDGASLVGNGSTKKIRVKRMVLSGRDREMDVVVRGYEV